MAFDDLGCPHEPEPPTQGWWDWSGRPAGGLMRSRASHPAGVGVTCLSRSSPVPSLDHASGDSQMRTT
jgi:hypothetical protein